MKCVSLFCLVICFALTSCKEKRTQPSESTMSDLPKMVVTTLGNSQIAINELEGNNILILFQSDCDHCQREAEEIRKHLNSFSEYNIYFISADQFESIKKFGADYDLIGHENIHFAVTTVDEVLKNFGSIPTPSVYIYSDKL